MRKSEFFYGTAGSKFSLDYGSLEYGSTKEPGPSSLPKSLFEEGTALSDKQDLLVQEPIEPHHLAVDRLIEEEENLFHSPLGSPRFSRRRDRRNLKKFRDSTSRSSRPPRSFGVSAWSPDVG